ncbi:MAG: hypothetical protein HYX49_11880 [Chloroflexi bacterium]|nr:hypothetical protein [Chloroflexota bacterium]
MNGKIALRIFAGLVLIAAIAGIAFLAFNAGVAQGAAAQLPASQSGNMPYLFYGAPFFWHPFWGFGFFGPLIALFLFFIALRVLRVIFWGPRWGRHIRGHWHDEDGVPPMFKEMHDRAHGQPMKDKKE